MWLSYDIYDQTWYIFVTSTDFFFCVVFAIIELEKGIRYFMKISINLKLNFILTQVLQNLQKQIIDRMILSTFSFRILAIENIFIQKYFKPTHFIIEGI